MAYEALYVVYLFVLVIHYTLSFDCGYASRTFKKATYINSTLLYEYLSYVDCQPNIECETWHSYTARCLKNTFCVGIRLEQPLGMCIFSNISRNGPLQMEGLWLITSELERFEGE